MARTRIAHEVDNAVIRENARTPEMIPFAETLNALLFERQIHQDDLAKALDISTGAVSDYRNGRKEPKLSTIIKLADYLDVDCHYLMTGIHAENYTSAHELGLSNGAINALRRATNGKPDVLKVLNTVLESYYFYHWLGIIYQCAYAADPRKEIFNIFAEDRFPNHSSKEIYEALAANWAAKVVSDTVETLNKEVSNDAVNQRKDK